MVEEPRLYHNVRNITINKTLSLENFDGMGPHQGFVYMLLTFKLL
jgi:hypothetical protein